ncbi:MAG: ABC transporter permease [Bacillota bacterium]
MISLKIAARFLFSSKMQTALITIGIAIGVSVQVFIGSLIQGLQDDLIDTTIGNRSQITIQSETEGELIEDDQERFEALKNFDSRLTVVSRVLESPATIVGGSTNAQVIVRGFNFEESDPIYNVDDSLTSGRLPESEDEILLGTGLMDDRDLSLDDTVNVLVDPEEGISRTMTIVGVFDLGSASLNDSWVLTNLENAKSLLDVSGISAYEMQLDDVFESASVQEDLESAYPELFISEWQAQNQDLLSGLEGQSISSNMIQVFVMISVVLGISSVLAITVLQKSRQLGILKAMGITDGKASLIFLSEGLILGVMGAVLGVLFGLFLAFMFSQFAVNPDGTPIVALTINPPFIAISAVIAASASVLAALIPARKSAKLSVIEVIRNG